MKWYYAVNGKREGPVEEEELRRLARNGRIGPSDFVWNETLGDSWQPASSVPGLFEEAPAGPASGTGRAVSCTAPVGPAWRGMKAILFNPLSASKWFALGFSAWLARLGEGAGGGSVSWNRGDLEGIGAGREGKVGEAMDQLVEQFSLFWSRFGGWVVALTVVAVLAGVGIALVMLWLRSRGKFMFLDNVVGNRAEIAEPWRVFAQHGNSLFRWHVLYSLICLLTAVLILALAFLTGLLPCLRARTLLPSAVPGLAVSGVLLFAFGVVVFYISRFLEDFVVPIMYKHDLTTTEAWRVFLPLFRRQAGTMLLYGLFYVVLRLLAGACIVAFVLLTCCIGGCLLGIPYLGAVLLLPVSVFFRLYSLGYLSQFGSSYAVIPESGEAE